MTAALWTSTIVALAGFGTLMASLFRDDDIGILCGLLILIFGFLTFLLGISGFFE